MTEAEWKAREDRFLTRFKEGQGTIVPLSPPYHPPFNGKGKADRRRLQEKPNEKRG